MKLKRHIEFLNESTSIHEGDFKVTEDMVSNGKMIAEKIPTEVTGDFECSFLELTSLEGCPRIISESFNCKNNKLVSLEGSPREVKGDFYCYFNQLTSLNGGPVSVDGYFNCSHNKLTSLVGSPKSVGEHIFCSDNKVDLEIEADYVKSDFRKDNYNNSEQYYKGLLKYMISNSIDLTEVSGWPKGFLTDNMIRSAKGISKFKL